VWEKWFLILMYIFTNQSPEISWLDQGKKRVPFQNGVRETRACVAEMRDEISYKIHIDTTVLKTRDSTDSKLLDQSSPTYFAIRS